MDWAMHVNCLKISGPAKSIIMPLKSWLVRVVALVVADSRCIMAIPRYLKARQKAIYSEDAGKPIRKSHENPYILELYEEFLGKPHERKIASSAAYALFR